MIENWKDIIGYEGFYQVSDLGNIKSIARSSTNHKNSVDIILKQSHDNDGYATVSLVRDKIRRTKRVHKLVAISHVDNPYGYSQVNHKKGIKSDNRASQLEWCTGSQNRKHAYAIGRKHAYAIGLSKVTHEMRQRAGQLGKRNNRRIVQYSADGIKVTEFESATAAAKKLGVNKTSICECARGEIKTSYGFKWKYA